MAKLLRVITTSATDEIRARNRPRKFRGDVKGTSPSRCVQVADSMDLIDSLGPVHHGSHRDVPVDFFWEKSSEMRIFAGSPDSGVSAGFVGIPGSL